MVSHSFSGGAEWIGPELRRPSWRNFRLGRFIVTSFVRSKDQKPTKSGVIFIVMSVAIGVAAYNTASNILFITLSLMLTTLLVSGLLSWLNFRRTAWRIALQPPFRAGEGATVALEIHNAKRYLPTYSLNFNFRLASGGTGRLALHERLDPGETVRREWMFRPSRRGRELIEMTGVSSQFPFGFLQKNFGGRITREVYVWPARVDYEASLSAVAVPNSLGDVLSRAGTGNDFVNLRRYQNGDSYRQIHWKASARQRQLMVRHLLAENHSGFHLCLETPASRWRRAEQFEALCSLVGSLAEDLFRQGRLVGAVINDGKPFAIHRVADLELLLDQLAVLEPVEGDHPARSFPANNVISFEPGHPEGVHAYVRGQKAATA